MIVSCWRGSSGAGAALLKVGIDAKSITAAVVMKRIVVEVYGAGSCNLPQ